MTRALGRTALLVFAATCTAASDLRAQALAEPILRGQALLGDTVLRSGTVILHRVSGDFQGEADSASVSSDGSFRFRLPAVPDPGRSEVYFASVRHAGILYFGKALTLPIQLDSTYEIQAYDTLMVPAQGRDLTVQARNIFLEAGEGGRWDVTDLFQVRNDEARTLVAQEGGVIWHHPLPEGAEGAEISQTDFTSGGAEVLAGEISVSAPIPPGERMFVVRYTVPDPFLSIPLPTKTEALEILIQEPAPPVEAPGLQQASQVELEPGSTFRRLAGADLAGQVVRLREGRRRFEPPVQWMAVILALILAAVGVWAVPASGGLRHTTSRQGWDRSALVLEVARLDEAFQSRADATPEERGAYEARRRDLLRRLAARG
ncbi:MAG: hypothetical protein Q8N53_23430 [Longimicrobiales bacterium]|nr:hypothetical protein [Longimicrobiales bacterium]